MGTLVAAAGWAVAICLGAAILRLRRRLELVAEAAHELRGPAGAIGFAVAALRREPGGAGRAVRFESELERMRAGLADLDAARSGGRAPARPRTVALERLVDGVADGWRASVTGADRGVTVRWRAGGARVRVDRRRIAQALGNLMANAAEHGSGPIEIHAVRRGRQAVRIEVRDGGPVAPTARRRAPDRGRGLRIADRAVREAGGALALERGRRGTVAAVELPLVGQPQGRAGR